MKSIEQIQKDIYSGYFNLDKLAYQDRIRYFEDHKREIEQLGFDSWIKISIDYTRSLFHVEAYYPFLKRVDELIENIITENIYEYNGEDIYKDLLLKKAMASLAIVDYHNAERVLIALIGMAPDNAIVKDEFIRCSSEKKQYENQTARSISIGLFFAAAIIIAIEILYVRSFKPELVKYFEWSRNGLFLMAVSNIVFQELRIRFLSNRMHKKLKDRVLHKSS